MNKKLFAFGAFLFFLFPPIALFSQSSLGTSSFSGTSSIKGTSKNGTSTSIGTSSLPGTSTTVSMPLTATVGEGTSSLVGSSSSLKTSSPPAPFSAASDPPKSPPKNLPPHAVIQIQSGSLVAQESTTLNFDGRASSDPNGDSLLYFWDFGDGTNATSANPSAHKYDQPGTYVITLTVIDPHGEKGQAQNYVQVLQKIIPANKNVTPPLACPTPEIIVKEKPAPVSLGTSSLVNTMAQTSTVTQPASVSSQNLDVRGIFVLAQIEDLEKLLMKKKENKEKKKNAEILETVLETNLKKEEIENEALTLKMKKGKKRSSLKHLKSREGEGQSERKISYRNGNISTAVRITEILPGPGEEDGEGEWIELFNSGETPVNLGNWKLSQTNKKGASYAIPDKVIIPAGGYTVLQKSETRIPLPAKGTTLVLTDFRGKLIDRVTYKKAKKDNSYALIRITETPPEPLPRPKITAQAAEPLPTEFTWEWTNEPTPGRANPTLEKMHGIVSRMAPEKDTKGNSTFSLQLSQGESKTIAFQDEILDPLMAKVILRQGTNILLQAQKTDEGHYELKKIEKVISMAPLDKGSEKNSWVAVLFLLSLGLSWFLFRFREKIVRVPYVRLLLSRVGFQKEKNG